MAERSNTSSTSSLTLPPIPGTSPDGGASPRRAVSPLLEVRRPHCTLNCESCNMYLEDIYRHSTLSVVAPDSGFPAVRAVRVSSIEYRIRCVPPPPPDRSGEGRVFTSAVIVIRENDSTGINPLGRLTGCVGIRMQTRRGPLPSDFCQNRSSSPFSRNPAARGRGEEDLCRT